MCLFLWLELPLCRCKEDIQTVEHILCDCSMVEEAVKHQLHEVSWKNLGYRRWSRLFELFEELRISNNMLVDYKKPEAQIMAAEIKETNQK